MDILDREALIIHAREKADDDDLDTNILKLLVKENHPCSHKNLYDIFIPFRYLCTLLMKLGCLPKDYFDDQFDLDQ